MARFFKSATPQFIDFAHRLPENLLINAVQKQDEFIDEAIDASNQLLNKLDFEVAPGHEERFKQINDQLIDEVDQITSRIMKDPSQFRRELPAIDQMTKRVNRSLLTGPLGAMKDMRKQYDTELTFIRENFKQRPDLAEHFKRQLDTAVGKAKFSEITGSYGQLEAPKMVAPVAPGDLQKLMLSGLKAVAEEFKGKIGIEYETVDQFTKLLTTGQVTGKPYEKIVEALSNMVDPNIVAAVQQDSDAAGRDVDESAFMDGLSPDLNTTLGKIIHGLGVAGRSETRDAKSMLYTDPAKLARLKAGLDAEGAEHPFLHAEDPTALKNRKETLKAYQSGNPELVRAHMKKESNYFKSRAMTGVRKQKVANENVSGTAITISKESPYVVMGRDSYYWKRVVENNRLRGEMKRIFGGGDLKDIVFDYDNDQVVFEFTLRRPITKPMFDPETGEPDERKDEDGRPVGVWDIIGQAQASELITDRNSQNKFN